MGRDNRTAPHQAGPGRAGPGRAGPGRTASVLEIRNSRSFPALASRSEPGRQLSMHGPEKLHMCGLGSGRAVPGRAGTRIRGCGDVIESSGGRASEAAWM